MAVNDFPKKLAMTLAPLLLKPPEAAAVLAISERSLWSRTASGEIPHVKIGRSVRYPVAELERWISERQERS